MLLAGNGHKQPGDPPAVQAIEAILTRGLLVGADSVLGHYDKGTKAFKSASR